VIPKAVLGLGVIRVWRSAGISSRLRKAHPTVQAGIPCHFPAGAPRESHKVSGKSCLQKGLTGKFPEFPAPFPAYGPKSADSGQNL
jgi:hypothetical protein